MQKSQDSLKILSVRSIDENGLYETASEYLRDLIRQDMQRKEAKAWMALREALIPSMKADRSAFVEVSAADVINRNKRH